MSETFNNEIPLCPPLLGGDIELGNFLIGDGCQGDTSIDASAALLAEFDGTPAERRIVSYYGSATTYAGMYRDYFSRHETAPASTNTSGYGKTNVQDFGRKFDRSGACAYIDLGHLELALPEVRSAYDFVKHFHAMLRNAAVAQVDANEKLRAAGRQVQVLVNNSDGQGHSWGAHTNVMISRNLFNDLTGTKLHYLLFLASFQVSSIIITGQGKVGSENDQPPVDFQFTQRGDFASCVCGQQTTYDRPLVNLRDEALCGTSSLARSRWARLHVIFYDANLCHTANYLKVGMLQLVLGVIASGDVNPRLILEDPVSALHDWGHDITMTTRCRTMLGDHVTILQLHQMFLDEAKKFVASGRCDLPDAPRILALWEDTVTKLAANDIDALAPRLDWALKLSALRGAMAQEPNLTFASPQIKCLDLMYSNLDPTQGIYWEFERLGVTEQIVPTMEIEHARREPPEGTRAWLRGQLLRRFGRSVDFMDWDRICFVMPRGNCRTLFMPDPLAMNRSSMEQLFEDNPSLPLVLDRINDLCEQAPNDPPAYPLANYQTGRTFYS